MAASEAVPTPASTITGTRANSLMIAMLFAFWMPRPDPIGAPSGITAAAPASSSLRHSDRVVDGVGQHDEAFLDERLRRLEQRLVSGNSVCSSPITSSFTQFDRPASRPSRAVRTASSAV